MAKSSRKSPSSPGMRPIFGDAGSGKMESKKSAWLLTNRNNLAEILSSGFLKPAHFASRHYADLGSLCIGYLPLLLAHPSAELVEQVRLEGEYNYPVLIKVSLDGLSGAVTLVTNEQSELADAGDSNWSGDALLVRGILPVQRINQIVFASYEEQQHVLQTAYGNVPTEHLLRSAVEAESFAGTLSAQPFINTIQSYHRDDETLAQEKVLYASLEKVAGGLALAATPLSNRPHLSFTALVQSLNLLAGHKPDGETQISLAVAGLLRHELPETASRSQNQLLLTSTAGLAANYRQGLPARDLVNSAYADVARISGEADSLRELRQDTFRVLNDEITLADFEARWPRKSYGVQIALLRFVLRGDKPPTRQQLVDDQAGTTDVLSWFLTGLYLGRCRLPVEAYPDMGLLHAIDSSVANNINQNAHGLLEMTSTHFVLVQSFGLETVFRSDDEIACFAYEGSLEQLVMHFQAQPKEDLDEQLAIDFCKIMGWTTCVQTTIQGNVSDQKDDLRLDVGGSNRRLTVAFHGFIVSYSEKLKVAEFRRRVNGPIERPSSEPAKGELENLLSRRVASQ